MRKIKFRAWHTQEHEMYHWGSGVIAVNHWLSVETVPAGRMLNHTVIELMQFTGLKDRNGAEIYEGDIVRINHPQDLTGDFANAIGQVYWDDDEAAYYHTNNHGRPPKRMWDYVEVIGNIYEHPQLLEPKP